jgi:hypothetical protein
VQCVYWRVVDSNNVSPWLLNCPRISLPRLYRSLLCVHRNWLGQRGRKIFFFRAWPQDETDEQRISSTGAPAPTREGVVLQRRNEKETFPVDNILFFFSFWERKRERGWLVGETTDERTEKKMYRLFCWTHVTQRAASLPTPPPQRYPLMVEPSFLYYSISLIQRLFAHLILYGKKERKRKNAARLILFCRPGSSSA